MTEAKQTDKRTLVEEGTELKGSLTSTCPVLVRGKVEGDVSAPALTVSPSGAVNGKARVGELHAEGQLSGEFDADVVQLSGKVQDRTVIRAKTLSVQISSESRLQVVFGECELAVGDPPPDDEEKTEA
jgi:cytoskeletal protein CcmA (bactofilin family)